MHVLAALLPLWFTLMLVSLPVILVVALPSGSISALVVTLLFFLAMAALTLTSTIASNLPPTPTADYVTNQAQLVARYANALPTPATQGRIVAEANEAWYHVQVVVDPERTGAYGKHYFRPTSSTSFLSKFQLTYPGPQPLRACVTYSQVSTNWTARTGRC